MTPSVNSVGLVLLGSSRNSRRWICRGVPLRRGAASVERLAQAVVGTRAARLQIRVDDPILVVAGDVVERQEMIGLFIFVLRLVNLKLAYHKGQYGRSVDRTGTSLQLIRQ